MGKASGRVVDLSAARALASGSVVDAAAADEMVALLVAIRGRLAEAMDDPDTQRHALGALASKLIEVQGLMDELREKSRDGGADVVRGVPFDPSAV